VFLNGFRARNPISLELPLPPVGEAYVTDYDRELREKMQSIEAHLAQHDKRVRRSLMGLTAIGILLLVFVGYAITRL
jgi:hypothetical protein